MSLHTALKGSTKLYFPVLFAAIIGGISFSQQTAPLASYSTHLLALLFFLSALKIDLREVFSYFKDRRMMLEVNLFMLVVLPIIVYYFTLLVYPELAIALLLLAAMPSGMTDSLLSEIVGGNKTLALVFTVTTSLLAPITIPLMLKLLAGATVAVSFMEMFILLAKVIFVPFIAANIIRYFFRAAVEREKDWVSPIAMLLLGLLTLGIVAKQADTIQLALSGGRPLLYLILLFTFFIGVHIVSYFLVFWRNKADRVAITICGTYMNVTLAIYLVDRFFTEPYIIAPVILAILPWSILLLPFKYIMAKVKTRS